MQLYIQSLMQAETDGNGTETRPARSRTEAVAEATGAWNAEQTQKLAAWTAWLDRKAEAEAKDASDAAQLAQEQAARATERAQQEAEAARARRQKEEDEIAESLRLAAVKKHVEQQSAMFDIPEGVAPTKSTSLSPSLYALTQLGALKTPSLILFSPDYIRDKQDQRIKTGYDESDISIMKLRPDGQIESVAAGAPRDLTPNINLSWNVVTASLATLAEAMQKTGKYSTSACFSIAKLSVARARTQTIAARSVSARTSSTAQKCSTCSSTRFGITSRGIQLPHDCSIQPRSAKTSGLMSLRKCAPRSKNR
jgi:hypothetical protein